MLFIKSSPETSFEFGLREKGDLGGGGGIKAISQLVNLGSYYNVLSFRVGQVQGGDGTSKIRPEDGPSHYTRCLVSPICLESPRTPRKGSPGHGGGVEVSGQMRYHPLSKPTHNPLGGNETIMS